MNKTYQELCDELAKVSRERDALAESARHFANGQEFYQGIVRRIGKLFGEAARTSIDGSVQDDVLALNVPELVEALAAHVERLTELLERAQSERIPDYCELDEAIDAAINGGPKTSLAHRIAHVAEQCDLPRLLRDYRAMVGLASITGPAKRERIEHVTSVEIAMFGAKQKYVISATRGRQGGGEE